MRRNAKYYISTIAILLAAVLIRAQFAGAPVNQWTAAPDMSMARSGACSSRLADGRVVVAGGNSASGAVGSVDIFGADGTIKTGSPMLEPRANSACITMADGRVFVSGGTSPLGALQSAEIYDPAADSWTPAGLMSVARSGHTATQSPWGAIILVGGETSGTVEEYLTNGSFTKVGKLTTPRQDYAVAALPNHTVLIFGGSDGSGAVNTVEMFNADTNEVSPAGMMLSARKNFGASVLYDGTVMLTGGYDRQGTLLGSTEIFDPAKLKSVTGPALSEPRANHSAYTLPNNGSVLLTGGTGSNGTLGSTEIYNPWNGKFGSPIQMHSARSGMASSLLSRGGILVAGGKSEAGLVSGVERYRFSTVETGKLDYHPGEVASFTGSGWKAGEQVLLQVQSFPLDQHNIEFTAVTTADSTGLIKATGFQIDASHLGAKFLLTAAGSASKAQTLFTDGPVTTTISAVMFPASGVYGSDAHVNGNVTDGFPGDNITNGAVGYTVNGSAPVLGSVLGVGGSYDIDLGSSLPPGTNTIQTYFTGNASDCLAGTQPCASSTSTAVTYSVSVTTTTTVNTPIAGASYVLGTTVPLQATVSGSAGYPGGSIAGTVSLQVVDSSTLAVIRTEPIVTLPQVGGVAAVADNTLPAGSYKLVATYVPPVGSGLSASTGSLGNFTVTKGSQANGKLTGSIQVAPATPTVGNATTITATVTGVPGIIPTGSIQFRINGSSVGAANLVSGTAQFPYNLWQGGNTTLTFDYITNGDPNYLGFVGQYATVVTVNQASTTTTASSIPATPVNFGTAMTLTANISGGNIANYQVGGTARFQDGATVLCNSVAVTNGAASCAIPAGSPLAVGTHQITVYYLGDGNFNISNNAALPYSLTINPTPSSTVVTASSSNINLGQSVTYTVTLTIPNTGNTAFTGAAPGGATVTDGVTTICTIAAGGLTGSGTTYSAVCPAVAYDGSANKGAGTHTVYATYAGGASNIAGGTVSGSSSQTTPITVIVNGTTLNIGALTTTPVTPIINGTATTLNIPYTLTGSPTPAPSQSFQIYDGATLLGSASAAVSPASFALPNSVIGATGTHTLSVKYPSGDTNYPATTSSSIALVVNQATTVVTPNLAAGGVQFGTPVALGASLSTTALVAPTGTLTFSYAGNVLGTCTLSAGSCSVTPAYKGALLTVAASPETINVAYSGDSVYAAASNTGAVTIIQNGTTGGLTTTPVTTAAFGTSVTLTANFAALNSGAGALTGTVVFTDSVSPTALGSAVISGGVASISAAALAPGSHTITATYSGDTNFTAPVTVPTATINITQGTTTVTLTPSPASVPLSGTVTFNYSVSGGPASTPPAGSIQIKDNGNAITNGGGTCLVTGNGFSGSSGNTSTGSCTVVYDGSAPDKAAGSHLMTATYTPSGVSSGVLSTTTSAIATVTVGANTAVISTPATATNPLVNGQTGSSISVTVTPQGSSAVIAGTVAFYDAGVILNGGASTVGVAGNVLTATLPGAVYPVGTHTITAIFTPTNSNYGSLTSGPLSLAVGKAATNFTNFNYVGTHTYGLTDSVSIQVNAIFPGTGTPTGTVTFNCGATSIGTATLNSGVATINLTTQVLPGSCAIGASYSGDSNFTPPANLVGPSITVNKNGTTGSVVTAPLTSASFGTSVTLTANFAAAGAGLGTLTGTVTFTDSVSPTALGSANIVGGVASVSAPSLAPGSHTITATYSGDTNFNAPGVAPSVGLTITAGVVNVTLTPSINPATINQSVIYTVTVTGGPSAPTGSVVINDAFGGGPIPCTSTTPLTAGVGSTASATCTLNYTGVDNMRGVGTHNLTAVYTPTPGSTNWGSTTSSSSVLAEVIGKVQPTLSVPSVTILGAATSSCLPNICVPYGTKFTISSTITPNAPTPAYTQPISILDNGSVITATTSANPATINGSGVASITNVLLAGGSHTIKSTYPGDANYLPADPSIIIVIGTTGLVASGGSATFVPNAGISAIYGGTIPATATLTLAPGAGFATPTGNIVLSVGATTIGTYTLNGGVATYSGAQLPASILYNAAAQTLTATYSGDANYAGGAFTNSITVAKATPVIAVGASPNSSNFGQAITFTVTAAPSTGFLGQPTGGVNLIDCGAGAAAPGCAGAVTLNATPIVLANGTGTYTTGVNLTPGVHNVYAAYLGDNNFLANNAAVTTETVNASNVSVTVTPSTYSTPLNTTVVYTILAQSSLGAPVGTVTLYDSISGAAVNPGTCSGVALVALAPPGNPPSSQVVCSVTYDNSAPAAQHGKGTHIMTVNYIAGNATFTNSSSAAVTVTVGVSPVNISQPVSSATNSYVYGGLTTLSAQLTPSAPTPVYSGAVNFYDNGTLIPGAVTGIATGAPSLAGVFLTAGTHTITAQFVGDSNYAQSPVSANTVIIVSKATPVVSYIGGPFITTYGGLLTTSQIQVSLAPTNGLTPTGTATLSTGAITLATAPVAACAGAPQQPACVTFTNVQLPNNVNVGAGQNLTVTYNGDSNYSTAVNSASNLTVNIAAANVTVTSAQITGLLPGTPVYGQNLTFTATFTGPGAVPTGIITFFVDGTTGICSGATITAGVATCTVPATPANSLGVGVHNVSVTSYSGDPNHTLTGGTTTQYGPFTVAPANTTTVLVDTPNPSTPGQVVTLVATVSVNAPGVASVLGNTVSILNGSSALTAACTGMTVVNNAGVFQATCTYAFPTAGPYNLSAVYSDASGKTAGSTGILVQSVGKPVPVVSSITSSANPSAYGQAVTFTAILTTPAGAPLPTGTLQFNDGSNTIGPVQTILSSTATTVTYTLTVPSGSIPVLTGGTHAISVSYIPGADPNYNPTNSVTQNPAVVLQQTVNRANSSTSAITVTANPSTIVFGEAVTFAVTVTPNTSGTNTGVPTGNVQFYDAGNPIGTPQPLLLVGTAQVATLSGYTGLAVGPHSQVTAGYLGDQNFSPSTSPNTAVPVAKDNTLTVLTIPTVPAPVYGAQITLSAQVCGLAPGSTAVCAGTAGTGLPNILPAGPTGTVTFYDGGVAIGTGSLNNSGMATLVTNLSAPSFQNVSGSPANSVVGNHNITAVYSGDSNFTAVQPPPTAAGVLTIAKGNTTSAVVSSANPSVTGQTVTFTATINAPTSSALPPTGTVNFLDGGVILGTGAIVVNGGVAQATLTVPSGVIAALTVGNCQSGSPTPACHVISVTYSGDQNYNTSSSPLAAPSALIQIVNKAATTTTIQSSVNASQVGQQITLIATVTVNSPGSGAPTGTVQFISTIAPAQPTQIGVAPVVAVTSGSSTIYTATLLVNGPNQPLLPQGNPVVDAVYSGDNNYLTSTSGNLVQSVQKTPTNITLTSSLTPSILGNQVTFAITVVPLSPGTGVPTGQIQIFDGTNQLATATLQGGQYQYVTYSLGVGNHAIGVAYMGDTNFQAFNSPTILQVVNKIPTSLNLTSNAPTAVASQIITFTAVLNPNPTPSVPNFASGQVGFYDGSNLMGVTNLTSNVATINVANLPVGLHQISAIYLGDGNWTGATSGFYAQTISPASTNLQIVSSSNPSVFGQPVTFTVTASVPFPGTVPAQGTVQLYDNNNALGDPQDASNGVFNFTVQSGGFAPGTHNIIARFLANGSFAGSQAPTLPQVVSKAPTVTTLAAQPNGSTSNQQVNLTAVVSIPTPGAGALTGTVQFVDTTFNQVLGTAPVTLIGGVYTASLATTNLNQSGSPQVLTATYSGDTNFASSTSNPQGQSVFGTQISAVNGAGYTSSNFASDSWVTIYGSNLASTQLTAVTTPFPTSLAGTTVSLTDANGTQRLAPIYFVSPGQVNALIPSNSAIGLATLTVTNPNGASASTVILITRTSPGLFSANASGQGVAAALVQRVKADGTQSLENVASYDSTAGKMVALPITIGSDSIYLQLYGTGIRYVSTMAKVTCTINGVNAPVLYASAAPGFAGLDQVNIQVPSSLAGTGTVNVVVTVDGQASNTVTLTFK